jgi:hypothetical protein
MESTYRGPTSWNWLNRSFHGCSPSFENVISYLNSLGISVSFWTNLSPATIFRYLELHASFILRQHSVRSQEEKFYYMLFYIGICHLYCTKTVPIYWYHKLMNKGMNELINQLIKQSSKQQFNKCQIT